MGRHKRETTIVKKGIKLNCGFLWRRQNTILLSNYLSPTILNKNTCSKYIFCSAAYTYSVQYENTIVQRQITDPFLITTYTSITETNV